MTNHWFFRASFLCVVPLAAAGCTSLLGDFSPAGAGADASLGDADTSDAQGEGGIALGTACTATTACGAGQTCSDGVCCDTACDGICESCKVAGSIGKCTAVPSGTDPDMECLGTPAFPPDAGAEAGSAPAADASGGDGATGDGASGDAALVDAAGNDAAPSDAAPSDAALLSDAAPDAGLTLPDGGVDIMQHACAGSCNGQRACSYPDSSKSCGSQFCATAASVARFACDGTGNCGLHFGGCGAYACEATYDAGTDTVGACNATCSQSTDCNGATSYCDGQHCQPQLGLGITCTNPNECQSGQCVQSVCCSSACDSTQIPGATCTKAGSVGKCECTVDCGDGGSCQLFYKDVDGDGYGDEFGSVGNGRAIVGCSGAPPAGYVDNNSDCDDNDANVHPGQTAWFTTPSHGTGTYDYDCDGTQALEYPVFPGASCSFCDGTAPSCADGTCSASQQATLDCSSRFVCLFSETPVVKGAITVDLSPVEPIQPIQPIFHCQNVCSGTASGFTDYDNGVGVACGQTGNYETCGTCASAGGYGVTGSSGVSQTQGCH